VKTERLKQARKSRGFTQKELANVSSFTQGQISNWEKGVNVPSSEAIAELATVLNVTSDYLLGLVDIPSAQISEDDLSDDEQLLIQAVRSGHLDEMLKAITAIRERGQD
jgi:transcriptional regulator with XRE-family HTH domain